MRSNLRSRNNRMAEISCELKRCDVCWAFKRLNNPEFVIGTQAVEGDIALSDASSAETVPEIKQTKKSKNDHEPDALKTSEPFAATPCVATLIAICAGLTGAAAMVTQIGWIRTITLMIGSSSYAFSLVVAGFRLVRGS